LANFSLHYHIRTDTKIIAPRVCHLSPFGHFRTYIVAVLTPVIPEFCI